MMIRGFGQRSQRGSVNSGDDLVSDFSGSRASLPSQALRPAGGHLLSHDGDSSPGPLLALFVQSDAV